MTAHAFATSAHQAFIRNAWLNAVKFCDTPFPIQMSDYRRVLWEQLGKVLSRPGAETLVALGDSPDVYLGFIAFDRVLESSPYVYFVYVKEAFRRMGIGRGLFAAAAIDPQRHFRYACHTPVVDRIREDSPYGWFARWDSTYARVTRTPEEQPT